MKKVNKKKGFTLAELLVVIAILAILVAIAVPIFTGMLDNAHEAVRDANYRAAQSEAMVLYLNTKPLPTTAQKYSYEVDSNNQLVVTPTSTGEVGPTSDTTGIVEVSF